MMQNVKSYHKNDDNITQTLSKLRLIRYFWGNKTYHIAIGKAGESWHALLKDLDLFQDHYHHHPICS